MKKILGFVAALLLALSLPMTVFAEGSVSGEIKIDPDNGYVIKVNDKGSKVDEQLGTSLGDGYTVVFVGNAYVTPKGATNVPNKTVNASDYKGDVVIHVSGKTGKATAPAASVVLSADDLSPVIVLAKDSKDSKTTPSKTSDGGKKATNTADSSNMFVYGGLLVVALGAIAAVVTAKKRNA